MTSQLSSLDSVLDRLATVEAENRSIRRAGAVVLSLVGAVLIMAQARPPSQTVEAERLVLRDAMGMARIVLSSGEGEGGAASLTLSDANGNPRGMLVVLRDGVAGVALRDQRGRLRLVVQLDSGGAPSLRLLGTDARARAELSFREGTAALVLKDSAGADRLVLDQTPQGGPHLSLLGALGDAGAGLSLTANGSPLVGLYHGRARTSLRLDDDGSTHLDLYDQDGRLGAALLSSTRATPETTAVGNLSGSSLVLRDKNGRIVFQAP